MGLADRPKQNKRRKRTRHTGKKIFPEGIIPGNQSRQITGGRQWITIIAEAIPVELP